MYCHVLINRYKQQSKNLSNTIRYKIQCSILLYNCTKRQKNLLKVLFVIKLQQMLTKTFITRGQYFTSKCLCTNCSNGLPG